MTWWRPIIWYQQRSKFCYVSARFGISFCKRVSHWLQFHAELSWFCSSACFIIYITFLFPISKSYTRKLSYQLSFYTLSADCKFWLKHEDVTIWNVPECVGFVNGSVKFRSARKNQSTKKTSVWQFCALWNLSSISSVCPVAQFWNAILFLSLLSALIKTIDEERLLCFYFLLQKFKLHAL